MQHTSPPVHPGLLRRLILPQQILLRSDRRKGSRTSDCTSDLREAHNLRSSSNSSDDEPWKQVLQFLYHRNRSRGVLEGLLSFHLLLGALPLPRVAEAVASSNLKWKLVSISIGMSQINVECLFITLWFLYGDFSYTVQLNFS